MLQIGSKKTHQPAKMEELVFLEIKISPVFVLQGLQVIYYTPTHRVGAILQSPCPYVRPSVRSHFRNRYLSFYWKKWFYIWYMAFAWWLVPCLPFPGLPHIYFLFTVRRTNERVGVFLARRSMQHLVSLCINLFTSCMSKCTGH